jgi:hypothetical protein
MSHRIDREAIAARVRLIAHERGLPAAETLSAHKSDGGILQFCERHGVSIDWLVCGDLRGRLRMARHAGERP